MCHIRALPSVCAALASFSFPLTKGWLKGDNPFGGKDAEATRLSGLSWKKEIKTSVSCKSLFF